MLADPSGVPPNEIPHSLPRPKRRGDLPPFDDFGSGIKASHKAFKRHLGGARFSPYNMRRRVQTLVNELEGQPFTEELRIPFLQGTKRLRKSLLHKGVVSAF
jgi:hypothetical protein